MLSAMLLLVYGMGVEPGLRVTMGIAVVADVDTDTKPFSYSLSDPDAERTKMSFCAPGPARHDTLS